MPYPADPSRAAVLSMDFHTSIVSIYAGDKREELVTRAAGVLTRAREVGVRVIHVRVGFRPGLPEVSSRNQFFSAIKNSPQHQQIFEGELGAIHPALAPVNDEIVITKHRVNAFAGTDLEMILRANDIDTLILMGIATSGVVLSTLVHAADADYQLTVIKDCCVDKDQELHNALVDRFFPSRASVITASQFLT